MQIFMNYLVINFVSTLDYLINTMCVYLFLKKPSPVLSYYISAFGFFHQKIQAKDPCDINEISTTNLDVCGYFILCKVVIEGCGSWPLGCYCKSPHVGSYFFHHSNSACSRAALYVMHIVICRREYGLSLLDNGLLRPSS